MFDVFPKALSSIASFLFPLFASYKALKTSDPAQLTPWLMYWVVLACALLVESWAGFVLVWIPFYAYIRLLFLLYLVLPQTQGARIIYQQHVHPFLEENEAAIEDFIAEAHDRLRAAGIAYLKRAIELLKTNVLGMPPSEEPSAASVAAAAQATTPQSYTQQLLARFSLPSARFAPGAAAASGADFYNLLASAVSAVTSTPSAGAAAASSREAGTLPGNMTASGTLIPPGIRGAPAQLSFIAAQRERLKIVLGALDREAEALKAREDARRAAHEAGRASSMSLDGGSSSAANDTEDEKDEETQRPASTYSAFSAFSGLSKSRSEADFEKIEVESGAEDGGGEVETPAAAAGGSWLPWAWGGSGTTVDAAKKND